MKKYITLAIILVTLASCGEKPVDVDALVASGDIEAIKAEREKLQNEITQQQSKMNKLDKALDKQAVKKGGPLVSTMKVKDTLFNHFLEIQGNVETSQNVIVSAEYGGVITRAFVKEGDQVRKGQILARIDDGGLSSQLAQLEVQSQLAKTTFERQQRLWDQKIGSEMQYLNAKANYEGSVTAVNQLKAQLGKTTVNAPFSGKIDQVITEQGSAVMPGTQLFRLVNLSDMYIKASVPESYLSTVREGKTVKVDFPVLNKSVDAKVRETSSFINPTNRTFTIEVDVPNKDGEIKPNLTAQLKINDYTSENAILVPLSVISENAEGDQYVYTAFAKADNEKIAKRVIVQTGRAQGDMVEILEGLKVGDEIIVEGARSVQNEQNIRILNN
ncbi:efflux RND transporter periplasmic adaptor subunit [Dokdonia sinensis]|uniref:Efflux RND transporter periplasmic adaptor subunit n=1 Tax=Dokdonia sinensis TaxID=2479847 RepID=A0A3M0GA26_9FLAO|nr:efflux RND transporter periplasmic adaptor subunit [Dokdonia sinensis]RMB58493.1 efflux RND transporter periplasmic adaptor subunit [Dokdonia sinensis]